MDFLLQCVLCSSSITRLIMFLVDEYRWIIFKKNIFRYFYKSEGRRHNSLTVFFGEIRASLIQYFHM